MAIMSRTVLHHLHAVLKFFEICSSVTIVKVIDLHTETAIICTFIRFLRKWISDRCSPESKLLQENVSLSFELEILRNFFCWFIDIIHILLGAVNRFNISSNKCIATESHSQLIQNLRSVYVP